MEQDSKLNNPLNTTDLSDFSKIESEKKKEKALKRKWFVLAVFFILSFTNGGAWGTYAAIVDRTKEYYGISSHQVLWFTWEYYITYVIFTFIVKEI